MQPDVGASFYGPERAVHPTAGKPKSGSEDEVSYHQRIAAVGARRIGERARGSGGGNKQAKTSRDFTGAAHTGVGGCWEEVTKDQMCHQKNGEAIDACVTVQARMHHRLSLAQIKLRSYTVFCASPINGDMIQLSGWGNTRDANRAW